MVRIDQALLVLQVVQLVRGVLEDLGVLVVLRVLVFRSLPALLEGLVVPEIGDEVDLVCFRSRRLSSKVNLTYSFSGCSGITGQGRS